MTTELTRRAGVALAAVVRAREIRPDEMNQFTRKRRVHEIEETVDASERELGALADRAARTRIRHHEFAKRDEGRHRRPVRNGAA
jgi:hypothetical protein